MTHTLIVSDSRFYYVPNMNDNNLSIGTLLSHFSPRYPHHFSFLACRETYLLSPPAHYKTISYTSNRQSFLALHYIVENGEKLSRRR